MATATIKPVIEMSVTDYTVSNDYNIRVVVVGKMVTVSGEIYGKGSSTGYITGVPLPGSKYGNAYAFLARDMNTGNFINVRLGSNLFIYRDSNMANGVIYDFTFSYCAA